ncbi:recombinase [Candidatus Magnetomorum sp. HK-1]|nr:recombinase [Candidatus Magnetomorum sp. HK-1]
MGKMEIEVKKLISQLSGNNVWLPDALEAKYPNAPKEIQWQYLFPSKKRSKELKKANHFKMIGLFLFQTSIELHQKRLSLFLEAQLFLLFSLPKNLQYW